IPMEKGKRDNRSGGAGRNTRKPHIEERTRNDANWKEQSVVIYWARLKNRNMVGTYASGYFTKSRRHPTISRKTAATKSVAPRYIKAISLTPVTFPNMRAMMFGKSMRFSLCCAHKLRSVRVLALLRRIISTKFISSQYTPLVA